MGHFAYLTTERQRQLVELGESLAQKFGERANAGDWAGNFPIENYQELRASGYLGLSVPAKAGGWGADLLEITLAQWKLGQGCASTALVTGMHLATIGRLSAQLKETDEFLSRIYQAVVRDGALINGAASEPATGSPSRGGLPSTVARRQRDGSWIITGRKTYTTGSPIVQLFLVSCRIEDEENVVQANRGMFLVPKDAPGVRVEETWNSLGMRGSGSHDLVLEDVHVDAGSLQPAQDAFLPSIQEQLSAWTLPTTAIYLGIAQAARDEAVRFAKRRRPNSLDQSIASVPHIQEKVAKMDLALIQCNAVLFGLAERFSKDPTSVPASQCAAAKYLVTNHAVEIVDLAMRLVGGASLSLSLPLQRYYRDVRAGLHHPPMDDATIAQLSKQAFAED